MLADDLVALVAALALGSSALLLSLYLRRRLLQRTGGTVELSWRLPRRTPGRGWAHGVARFDGDTLRWWRALSLSPRPRQALSRRGLVVLERREPRSEERRALPGSLLVLHCQAPGQPPTELAVHRSAAPAFFSWLEATPPGATLPG